MNLTETAAVVAKIATYDNRRVDEATILAWHDALAHLNYQDCLNAVTDHYRTTGDYLMPVHIHRGARRIAEQRELERTSTHPDEWRVCPWPGCRCTHTDCDGKGWKERPREVTHNGRTYTEAIRCPECDQARQTTRRGTAA